VVGHPLADWSALAAWRSAHPLTRSDRAERNWGKVRAEMEDPRRIPALPGVSKSRTREFNRIQFRRHPPRGGSTQRRYLDLH